MTTFIGVCGALRNTKEGEQNWQRMISFKMEVPLNIFLFFVSHLEFRRRWGAQFHEANAQDPSRKAFVSLWENDRCIFYQNAGWEYIWKI